MLRLKVDHDDPEALTVGKLRTLLAAYPDDMPVCYRCCSQWTQMYAREVAPLRAFDNGGYVSEVFDEHGGRKATTWLAFPGN